MIYMLMLILIQIKNGESIVIRGMLCEVQVELLI